MQPKQLKNDTHRTVLKLLSMNPDLNPEHPLEELAVLRHHSNIAISQVGCSERVEKSRNAIVQVN